MTWRRSMKRQHRRTILAGLVSTILVGALAAPGGVGLAKGPIGAAQSQNGKITICHEGRNTITISANAWPAHQAHGDTLGPCSQAKKKNRGRHNGSQNHPPNPGVPTTGQSSAAGNGNGHGKKKWRFRRLCTASDRTRTATARASRRGGSRGLPTVDGIAVAY